ncbi:FtsW/RodA/SpoVE family cell cycle protein [Gracilibacillus timonensis]|uniref:FtsW/RodA/SpoVE family cell cycle protein n=1 Tax=Gracilibacillus timonensis TaxID=1816696 RepID=UPI00082559B4|nr:FtsW/RodA/SpoVE family cell cycle protein [Gracilibacillus timonensis]
MQESSSHVKKIDYMLIFIVILLGIVSIFTLYTLQPYLGENYYFRQIIWYIGGAILIGVVMFIDYDRILQVSWFIYSFGVLLLVMLYFHFPPGIASNVNNAWSWFDFGFFSLQPAEIMKVFLIIHLAHIVIAHKEKFEQASVLRDLWLLVKIALLSLPPMILIALQPDLGSFLVLVAIVLCMILVSGIQWKVLLTLCITAVVAIGAFVFLYISFPEEIGQFADDYGFDHVESRFSAWLDPDSNTQGDSYQLNLTMRAIGSGQLSGKGLSELEVPGIPERQTDMVFSAIAEQFGFIGSSLLILLFFMLIYRLIQIGLQSTDPFGSLVMAGMIGMFTYQIFQNVGMSINLLPITGLPLPFISYGGSSTLTYLLAIGLALNIYYRTKTYMFGSD